MTNLALRNFRPWKLAKKGTFSVAKFGVKLQVGENEALSLVEGLEKIFLKLSIEEKMKPTKITKMVSNQ